jgi:hypothetical protein
VLEQLQKYLDAYNNYMGEGEGPEYDALVAAVKVIAPDATDKEIRKFVLENA